MANHEVKRWFAIRLGKLVDHRTVIPSYICKSLVFAHGTFSGQLIFNILKHQVRQLVSNAWRCSESIRQQPMLGRSFISQTSSTLSEIDA
ncbi:hypothetical protein M2375_004489 [Comamonas sp. BIGb0152]|uniref:hypothetical protein n=1 Tax=Comamonas sp. BIGb0152 TaxID=2940601 RepID=UPI00216998E6|nr:hypothetical protein [Comamonas sp. BIGb0152]MCS4296231.1 hypothetical protein [Comamonas sp. BIGb0152]